MMEAQGGLFMNAARDQTAQVAEVILGHRALVLYAAHYVFYKATHGE
jgi:hypothetical protein